MSTLLTHLDKVANKMPEKIAIVFGDEKIQYGRLFDAIKRLAQGLKDIGVQKGDRVAIMLPNLPHFPISYYAVLQIGAIVVPINFMYKNEELQYFLNDCQAKVLISWAGFCEQILPAVQVTPNCHELVLLGERLPQGTCSLTQLMARSSPLDQFEDLAGEDVAVINYTAGVTSDALGAEFTHDALFVNANLYQDMFKITADQVLAGILPLFHPLGQNFVMNVGFLTGAQLVLLPRFGIREIMDCVTDNQVTFLPVVPGMLRALINTQRSDSSEELTASSLKYCLSYGGRLTNEIIKQFEDIYHSLVLEAYGLTEAGPLVAANRIDLDRKTNAVGLPLVGVDVQIRDENRCPLMPNENGEIWVKSAGIMRGYYNKPDETRKRIVDGWLFTGDIGFLDMDHYLYVLDRKEDIISKAGFNIFPTEVEDVLLKHPAVLEVAIVGVPDPVHSLEVKAFVVLKSNMKVEEEQLVEFCKQSLPVYKVPKYVQFCTSLPKSPTGRILKRLLRNIELSKEQS